MIVQGISEEFRAGLQIATFEQEFFAVFYHQQLDGLKVMHKQSHLVQFVKQAFNLALVKDHSRFRLTLGYKILFNLFFKLNDIFLEDLDRVLGQSVIKDSFEVGGEVKFF